MMFDLKKEIREAFAENKLAVGMAFAILIISLISGFYLEPSLHDFLNPVLENFVNQIESGNIEFTFQSIFSNNMRILFLMFLLGLLFCFSAFLLAFNGFFVGYVIATSGNFFNALLLTVPHGIFELPSCAIACASGFVLFNFLWRFVKTFSAGDVSFLNNLYSAYAENFTKLKHAFLLFMISCVLMLIAGFVEVYMTIPIAGFISSLFS